MAAPAIWIVVGASRGIGLEWVRQLLARGDHVLATVRDVAKASRLWTLAGSAAMGRCQLFECDVASEASINNFAREVAALRNIDRIDYVILNAGILQYPNRATELSFDNFSDHLRTNAVGPIITAQRLLHTGIPIGSIAFMSSDSGSATDFRDFEDGFAAYAASKAALNQMLRHMASELARKRYITTILAMHPGEVATDMANVSLGWEVEGIINADESVAGMLRVVEQKTILDTGTFWTWEGNRHPW
ncbi:hypothetical protein HO173_001317 [Letharia columbiana]|uniref:Uncharacterized protein n=1 Tax=Letharia columbiana TaxID=112416 RepID=A0A8H6G580_9LECA|nr:uncharacterized protein HO173_001317 [Letharia columbiana]KAF6240645.1 hypothetical protein HO173_001317 [Letharia columbiana]